MQGTRRKMRGFRQVLVALSYRVSGIMTQSSAGPTLSLYSRRPRGGKGCAEATQLVPES